MMSQFENHAIWQRIMLKLGWLTIVLMGAMMLGFSAYVAYVLLKSVL